jgi:hypothetical protein
MSYSSMLKHRCTLLELRESFVNGVPSSTWVEVATAVRCFLDLNFLRKGKDPMWTPEAGRPGDRSGVCFLADSAPIKSGMRIKMTKGPTGTFLIEGAVDEAWQPTKRHHFEVGVIEVPKQISKGQGDK